MNPQFWILIWAVFSTFLGTSNCAFSEERPEDAAIQNAVKYLKANYLKSESNYSGDHTIGAYCLIGMALLEGRIASDDPVILKITELVRSRGAGVSSTYASSAVVMYLDRLGEKADIPLIQLVALRILGGQSRFGDWGYDCGFSLNDAECARLRKALYQPQWSARDIGMHIETIRFSEFVARSRRNEIGIMGSDNSNSQFAALALWLARKHGISCNDALALSEKRVRSIQQMNGGWEYNANLKSGATATIGIGTTPSMTCAGLVAIATGHGTRLHALRGKGASTAVVGGQGILYEDKAVMAAFKYLENAISGLDRQQPSGIVEDLTDNLYFLWSLERVAMIYGVDSIGKFDWFRWGSQKLLTSQSKDGSWTKLSYTGANPETNTAFAILFLTRANLAKDLTATLKGKANVKLNLPDRITNPDPVKVEPKVEPKQTPGVATDFESEADRLCNMLVAADASKRSGVLVQLRDAKGSVYTEALVRAIAKSQGEPQREAREALAQRLKRMTAATLRDMFKDANKEIRSAAATACGLKEDKQYTPELIAVLGDAESLVVQSARTSLRTLSGKDFGPSPEAAAADKATAIAAWRAWWASQGK